MNSFLLVGRTGGETWISLGRSIPDMAVDGREVGLGECMGRMDARDSLEESEDWDPNFRIWRLVEDEPTSWVKALRTS